MIDSISIKSIFALLVLLLTLVISYSQESEIDFELLFDSSEVDLLSPMEQAILFSSFKDDNISIGGQKGISALKIKHMSKARKMKKALPMYKNFKEYVTTTQVHPDDIQSVSQHYLKYFLLPLDSNWALEEIEFLLGKLIESKAIDMDMLADTYQKVEHRLSIEEKERYLNYMNGLYARETKALQNLFPEIKAKYLEQEDQRRRVGILFQAKGIERRWKSAQYAKELLGLSGE